MEVIVKRSARRKKTIQARLVNGAILILAPKSISDQELEEHIASLRARIERRMIDRKAKTADEHLLARARYLNAKYFGGKLTWESISYSSRQMKRHGSCTVTNKTIRISHKMREMPQWVEDYIILHELAHLVEPNHGKEFKKLVRRYPLAERAMGYLMAMDGMKRRGGLK